MIDEFRPSYLRFPMFTQILVNAERVANAVVSKYPTLTKVVLPSGAAVITGSITALNQAKQWLEANNHPHSTK